MRKSAKFLSIMIVAECVPVPLHAAERPSCQLTQYESADFVITPSGHVVFPVTVGGNPTYAFLNFGSSFNSVSPSATQDLKLTKYRIQTPAGVTLKIDGKAITEATRVPVSIGNLRFGTPDFLVTTETGIEMPRVTARLGMSFFSGADVELDFANKKIKFFSQDHCPGEVVYWTDQFAAVPLRKDRSGGTYLVMELAGKKVEAVLGTDEEITSLDLGAANTLFGLDVGRGSAAPQQFMELTTNGLSVMNAQVTLRELRGTSCRFTEHKGEDKAAGYVNCFNVFPLKLGMNVLENMHIYIATKENVLYFTAADAHR